MTFTITTSTKLASVSLFKDDKMLANFNINVRQTHSTSIIEQIEAIFKLTNTKITDVKNVILSKGPGSFTGIRIAMALVKGMFCLDDSVNIYEVSELDVLNYMAKDSANLIVSAIDSRKMKVYATVVYKKDVLKEPSVYNYQDLIEFANSINDTCLFIGDAAINYKDKIHHPKMVSLPYERLNINSMTYYSMFKEDMLKKVNIDEVEPDYLEKSQAEKEFKNGNIKG